MSKLDFHDNRTLFRAVYAAIALHGVLGKGNYTEQEATVVAVQLADKLLDELEADNVLKPEDGIIAIKPKARKYK